MCGPTNLQQSRTKERKRVVISGAGPAGLLLCSHLLNKNKDENCSITYDVTLLDGREDYASFTKQEMAEKHRSWMLGLADHGMDAIKSLPVLYENYVKGEGIEVREFNVFLGKKKISQGLDSDKTLAKLKEARGEAYSPPENFIVDRNYIVAALARYLKDTHENDPHYTSRYETKCQYVDYENRRVLVRDVKTNDEEYVSYDLLVGCDGVRSTVREALVKLHSDFHLEYTDIFSEFKQTHVTQPPDINPSALSILPEIFPHCNGIVLPETGGLANISIGCPRNKFDDIDDELKSDDYKVVSAYFEEKFKAFELVDYDDFAKQWVAQRWNQTGMVHCNFYHSLKAGIVIMGDAAHATSPSIGMGMNTALRDAQIFSSILEDSNNDFEQALPAFSEARVKEGNSLSDLAFNLSCLDTTQQMLETIHSVVRNYFYMKFPRFVNEHPFSMIGRRGVSLSECYDQAVKLGIMNKHRVINNRIRMQHFEQKSGMIQTSTNQGRSTFSTVVVLGAALATGVAYAYQHVV
jgi:kynurenine 3-monooxygenase